MQMEELIGQSLNRYKLLSLLGKGGMGAVYKATDPILQRDIAIKVMSPEFAANPNFRDRFLQEARATARLDHPNIVRVHDFGQSDELLFIVMEYIPGPNLRHLLQELRKQKKWVILTEAIQIVWQVCMALDYANSQGVLHRDVKPDNLMLKPEASDGLPYRVVLTDLGLAELAGETEAIPKNTYLGTPAYMSPEQAQGQKTDTRSDVYSLGILLYELTVGRLPFPAETISEAIHYHKEERAPLPRSLRPDLPIALEKVILKALEKEPDQRYPAPGELAQALESVLPAVTEVSYKPSGVTETVSLSTQVDLTPRKEETVAEVVPDYIEVSVPGQAVHSVVVKPTGMTIGREKDNDLVLDFPNVSRHHTRLQFDGNHYWVSDLNSKNGTYLENSRLIPGEPVKWETDKLLRIGEATLRLKRPSLEPQDLEKTRPPLGGEIPLSAETVASESILHPSASSDRIGIVMETIQLSVTPGNSTTAAFIIQNLGTEVNHFKVGIMGISTQWIPSPPPVVRISPGSQQEVKLLIQPPQSPDTRPGRYPLTIQVSSKEAPDVVVQVEATLMVGVYSLFSCELNPHSVYTGQPIAVSVQNQGNARELFTILPRDQEGVLVFDPSQARLAIQPGEAGSAEFTLTPRQPLSTLNPPGERSDLLFGAALNRPAAWRWFLYPL